LVNAYIAISTSRCGRVVNGFILEHERKITIPSPPFIFEARLRPKSLIYRVSQDMRFCGGLVTQQSNVTK